LTTRSEPPRIYLSPPHMSDQGLERRFFDDAFDSNWIAPLGPHVDAFEHEFAEANGSAFAAALCSGTAALHIALRLLGVGPGDTVLCPTLTFVASANPIRYLGAEPVFVDSERSSWNVDPALVEQELATRAASGAQVRAAVVVDLYGQSADFGPIVAACKRFGVPIVEDAAEALGGSYRDRRTGNQGAIGVFSFNGNKMITTSGGGMLVADDPEIVEHCRFLATQARDPAPHYQHSELGYNYRMSNLLAAVGRGQLRMLDDRVATRRAIFEKYRRHLGDLPGLSFMPEAAFGRATRWLTCLTIDPVVAGVDRETVRMALEAENIESRPVWKPLHLQPLFEGCHVHGGGVAERLFETGLCLPSGSNLSDGDQERIIDIVRRSWPGGVSSPS